MKNSGFYSAALERAYKNSADINELASAVQEVMARFVSDTENRFYALENSRIVLKHWMNESPLAQQPTVKLEKWLTVIRPALQELGEASLRQITPMLALLTRIINLLQIEPKSNHGSLSLLFQTHGQIEELAAQARHRHGAWISLLETIQQAIRTRLVFPERESQVRDVIRAAEALIRKR